MRIDFDRFSKNEICPTKGSADAAGFDLYTTEEVLVPPSNVRIVPTDIGFKIPKGYFDKIPSRSSFAMQFTGVGGGVIDSDYRGPVAVVFFNFSNRVFEIEKGQRFSQIIFQKIASSTLTEVPAFDDRTECNLGALSSSGTSVECLKTF